MNKVIYIISLIFLITASAFITYKISYKNGYNHGFDIGEDKKIKSELDESLKAYEKVKRREILNKIEFSSNEDFDQLASILYEIKQNPNKDLKKQFSKHIHSINLEIINHISKSYGFTDVETKLFIDEYNKINDSISLIYYERLQNLNSNLIRQELDTFNVIQNSIVSYNTYTSAVNFGNALSSLTCSLFDIMIGLIRMNPALSFASSTLFGVSCQIYMKDIMPKYNELLKASSLYYDIQISKVTIEKQIRQTVSKLITVEDDFSTTVYRSNSAHFLVIFNSTAEAGFIIHSRISAGVDLNKYYNLDINHTRKEIILTLSQPEILSIQSDSKISYIEDGYFAKITPEMLNEAISEGNYRNEEQATNSGILISAKVNSVKSIMTFIQPMLSHPAGSYKILVKFLGDEESGNTKVNYN